MDNKDIHNNNSTLTNNMDKINMVNICNNQVINIHNNMVWV